MVVQKISQNDASFFVFFRNNFIVRAHESTHINIKREIASLHHKSERGGIC